MKNKSLIIILIILLIILILFILSIMFYGISNNYNGFISNGNKNYKIVYKNSFENNINKIIILTSASNINIEESKDLKIHVKIYGKSKDVKVNKNNELNINYESEIKETCKFLCFNTKSSKIDLLLPKEYFGIVNINNKYGDLSVGNFNNLVLNSNLDAGDINIKSCKEAVINSKYGDIKINEVNRLTDINASYGDIKINNLNINKNSKIKTSYGDIEINNTNDIYIKAKTSFGDNKVENNNKNSNITLNINTNYGDIEVN